MGRQELAGNDCQEAAVPGDPEIRSALRVYLQQRWAAHCDTTIIEELGLCRGQVRIDLAVVNGALHAYEIKSDRDRLDRLTLQAEIYGRVVDRATIVVGARHLEEVLEIVPAWWGVLQVDLVGDSMRIRPIRSPCDNPHRVARALAELLWREEALAMLEDRHAAQGVRSKPRPAVWDRLCEVFDLSEIATAVRERLKMRADRSAPA